MRARAGVMDRPHQRRAPPGLLGALLLLCVGALDPARAQDSDLAPGPALPVTAEAPGFDEVVDDAAPFLELEITLRAWLVTPKFRFRDGNDAMPGSSFRTQKIGCDEAIPGVGAGVGLRIDGDHRVGVEYWGARGLGRGELDKDMLFDGVRLRAGDSITTDYTFDYIALEYLYRIAPLGWFWVDLGARVEYLRFKVGVAGVGHTQLEAAYPTPRVHVGVRPFPWLELEGRFGGFELTVPLGRSTWVEQPYEVGGLVRVHLPFDAFVEAGYVMYHVHLEEAPGEVGEDALHLRHRAVFVSLGLRF